MREELKECPWCGNRPYIDVNDRIITIGCYRCQYSRSFNSFISINPTNVMLPNQESAIRPEYYQSHATEVAAKVWNARKEEK